MTETKFVEIAQVGDEVKKIAVDTSTTVASVVSSAGYEGDLGTIYGQRDDGSKTVVQMDTLVNGYCKFMISTNVKGGI